MRIIGRVLAREIHGFRTAGKTVKLFKLPEGHTTVSPKSPLAGSVQLFHRASLACAAGYSVYLLFRIDEACTRIFQI